MILPGVLVLLASVWSPPVQRPGQKHEQPAKDQPANQEPAADERAADEPVTGAAAVPEGEAADGSGGDDAPEPEGRDAAVPTEVAAPEDVQPSAPAPTRTRGTVTPKRPEGPPYYTDAEMNEMRKRHGLGPTPKRDKRQARWKCLIADPSCGFSFEINATSAYAYRVADRSATDNQLDKWSSSRTQYDLWLNIPTVEETVGDTRYTRMTMGPKGGLIASDNVVWGNVGFATRYWFGRGRWAPSLEFTSALTFRVLYRVTDRDKLMSLGRQDPAFEASRGPVGFHADIGVGIGGFGAIVIGGQYDSPLAREDVPEPLWVLTSGMFYVGFRGNILWGVPAVGAVASHALGQRLACTSERKNEWNGSCP